MVFMNVTWGIYGGNVAGASCIFLIASWLCSCIRFHVTSHGRYLWCLSSVTGASFCCDATLQGRVNALGFSSELLAFRDSPVPLASGVPLLVCADRPVCCVVY